MMPTPSLVPPRSARFLYDMVVHVVSGSSSYEFFTSSGCSEPLPSGGGSKSFAAAILMVLLTGAELLGVDLAPLLVSLSSPVTAGLIRNCAIAITDSRARTASRIRIHPPRRGFSTVPYGVRSPPPPFALRRSTGRWPFAGGLTTGRCAIVVGAPAVATGRCTAV